MKRAEFSAATRRAIWERAKGQCEACNAPLEIGCFAYDHIITAWMSGRNDVANGQLLCIECHKAKTAADKKDIAKVKRIRKKAAGKKSRRPLAGGRGSKLKRKISGKVVIR